MNKPWENEECIEVYAYNSLYPVQIAAALWCGIPPNEITKYLDEAAEVALGTGIFRHPKIPCLEAKCQAMHRAISENRLPVSRENGKIATDHVSPARRRVSRQDLKEWLAKEFPSHKPAFLFDDIERKSHPAINADSYQALQADRDALRLEAQNTKRIIEEINAKYKTLLTENESLKTTLKKLDPTDPRSETTYLNIIGGLLELMLSKSPGGQMQSIFTSQSAIIEALLAHYSKKDGISERNLEKKFSEAKKTIKSS